LIEVPRSKVRIIDGQIKIKREENDTNSRLLVSECMVMTGRVAAEILLEHKLPGPFRFHREPSIDLPSKFKHHLEIENQKELEEIPKYKGNLSEVFDLLENMNAAEVDVFPKRHWAMGLDAYVKATSPLRRYLDLVTHRQLYSIIEGNRKKSYSQSDLSIMIPPIYRHELYVKKLQKQATRFWINMYLSKLLSKEQVILDGTILEIDPLSGIVSIFLDFPALLTYQARIVNVAELREGMVGRFKLIEINVLRGFVKLLYVK
jgi:exoribonuclease-2